MKTISVLSKFESNPLWGYHLPIDTEIANKLINGKERRVVCTLNNLKKLQSGLMPSPLGYFIMINQNTIKELSLRLGDKVALELVKDNSEYGMEMPDELRELLFQDAEGSTFFHQLTPGKQRSLIYLVAKVKNMNSRLNRSLAIVYHIKEMKGKIDFKILNETIKYYNNL